MASTTYTGLDTYVVYKKETAWGTAAAPAGTDYVDRVNSISTTMKNNRTRYNSLGTGANASVVTNGTFDVSGSISAQFTNPAFFRYLINGVAAGNAGTEADPEDINEVNSIGYTDSTMCPSMTLEYARNLAVDDEVAVDGVTFTSWKFNAKTGEPCTWSADYRGRYVTVAAASALTYTGPTEEPLNFTDASMTIGGDTVLKMESIELSGNNNYNYYYNLGSRFLQIPTMGTRRYDFTITVLHTYDDTASSVSGVELRGMMLGADGTATVPEATGVPSECGDIIVTLTEGAATGDETVSFKFESCYIEDVSEPVEIGDDGGPVMLTITGFALAGLTNSTENTVIEYYTHS